MGIDENVLGQARSESQALKVKNLKVDLNYISYQLKAQKYNGTTSFAGLMT
jgi:hypothetical protein